MDLEFKSFLQLIEDHFRLEERRTTIANEVRAGISTFLTMCYILLVNPQVLSLIGIPAKDVVVSTALSAGIGSIITGLFGNLPFGLAPGIGLSAYLVYGLVLNEGMSLQLAFTACFLSGLLILLFTSLGISSYIMSLIPKSVKLSTIVGMGLQIALVGMTSVHLVVKNNETIVGMGPLTNHRVWLALFGVVLIGSLLFHQIRGAIFIGIIFLSLLTWIVEAGEGMPSSIVQFPYLTQSPSTYISFSPSELFPTTTTSSSSSSTSSSSSSSMFSFLSALVSFLFVGIIDVSGVAFGMSSLARLTDDEGNIPGGIFAFFGCGVGTLVSACTGGTPLIVYVESAAGIKEGSRSGLSAVVVGCLFLASLFLAPLFSSIPVPATAPISILVGGMMMSQATEIDWEDMSEAIPAFLTLSLIPFTFSITNGILFGLLSSFFLHLFTGPSAQSLVKYIKESMGGEREGGGEGNRSGERGGIVVGERGKNRGRGREEDGFGLEMSERDDVDRLSYPSSSPPYPSSSSSSSSSSSLTQSSQPYSYQSLSMSMTPPLSSSPPSSSSFSSSSSSSPPQSQSIVYSTSSPPSSPSSSHLPLVRTPSLILTKQDAEAVRKARGMSLEQH